jgi:hypothetical protein
MTLRLGLMFSLQVHGKIVSWLQLQIERQKMNVGCSYILCQHLNFKCYLVNMTTTIVPSLQTLVCVILVLKYIYLLTLFTLRCNFSPNSLLKEIWHWENNNNTNFVYTSMHEKIYMDMDNLMHKKIKDLFVSKNIDTSRKRLKHNQMICDYMQLIVIYN